MSCELSYDAKPNVLENNDANILSRAYLCPRDLEERLEAPVALISGA